MVSLDTPPVYERIAASEIDGTVVSLPLGWLAANGRSGTPGATFVELYQMTHRRPLLGGTASRTPPELITSAAQTPVLDFLSAPAEVNPTGDPRTIAAAMEKYQIAFIVVHKVYPLRIYQGELLPRSPIFDAATLEKIDRYITDSLKLEKFEETEEIIAYREAG